MRSQSKLDFQSPLSEDIVKSAQRVQAIEAAWHPAWSMPEWAAGPNFTAAPPTESGSAVGVFFSGGVDSFYTLQKNRQEITHLIFVSGFDLPLHRRTLRQLVLSEIRETAAEINLPLIEVETNLREFTDELKFSWEVQHGAALAAVAHFLAPGFRKILIPSSYAFPFLSPYGSHPALDPLWSSRGLQLVHDGIEATRFDKIGSLTSWDTAVRHLRVCWQRVEGQYNCCRCRKCLWTMAFLRAHGALDRARSFPAPLDLKILSEQKVSATEQRYRLIQAIAKLEIEANDQPLAAALGRALNQGHSVRRAGAEVWASFYRRVRRIARGCWKPLKAAFQIKTR
jgi:hypothetical protein